MYGIRIDEETREFSVVDTREFGVVGHGLKVAFNTIDGSNALDRGFKTIDRANRRLRRGERRDNRRVHRERMAMIKAGMDPTQLEDSKTKQMRERHSSYRHRLDTNLQNAQGSRSLRAHELDNDLANNQDRRLNRTRRIAVRKLR